MSQLRAAIVAELDKKLADATLVEIACSALAEELEPALGYEPGPTHVSRVMRELGWIKQMRSGHVTFARPLTDVDPASVKADAAERPSLSEQTLSAGADHAPGSAARDGSVAPSEAA